MGKTDSKWRGYVRANSKTPSKRPKTGTVTNGAQASTRLGGGTNAVASTATPRNRSWAVPGGLR